MKTIYVAPQIEVVEIEIEDVILQGSDVEKHGPGETFGEDDVVW